MRKSCLLMKSILALCLCLVLPAGTACAEEIVEISTGDWTSLHYECTLPDGRILLAGDKLLEGSGYDMRAWVLCLNPDRTVSWEFVDAADGGHYGTRAAALLPDGTIGVVLEDRQLGDENRSDRYTLHFFTQDGEMTERVTSISPKYVVYDAYPYGVMMYGWREGDVDETLLVDWNGKELLRYDGLIMPGAYGWRIDNSDEPVFVGHNKPENGHAKIMKLDGLTDRILWETTLDWQLPDTKEARLLHGIRTEDGGYIALLQDGNYETPAGFTIWRDFLVKFDAEGRVQWIHRDSFEKNDLYVQEVFSYNGKIGILCEPESDDIFTGFVPLTFLWFDLDGNKLCTTEWLPDPDEFSVMKKYLEPEGPGNERVPSLCLFRPFQMGDGLWSLADCNAVEWENGEYIGTCDGSQEILLVKIPEPKE